MPPILEAWVELPDPAGRSEEELLAYFGLRPPVDPEALDANVFRKRRHWRKMENTGNPNGKVKAFRVIALIDNLAAALLRGAEIVVGPAPEAPEQLVATVVPENEFWDHVQDLLMAGRLDDALRVCEQGKLAYPRSWVAFGAHGYAVWVGVDNEWIARDDVIHAGVVSLDVALKRRRSDPVIWEAVAGLLMVQRRYQDVLNAAAAAEEALAVLPSEIQARRSLAHLALDQVSDGLVAAARAVHAAPDDKTVRGILAEGLIVYGASRLLPLREEKAKDSYREIVATAAWCAEGVYEAENYVRPHRLWAAKCDTRVFSGNYGLRTLLGTLTLFVAPFIHNLISSRPAWKIYWDGPVGGGAFDLVARSPDVEDVHRGLPEPPSWSAARA